MRRTDSAVEGTVLLVSSVLISVVAGLLMSFPWQAILLVVAATVISVLVITAMASSDERRDTQHWQEAVVAASAWASRNAGRCETNPSAFADDEWTMPASPRFSGTILAVGRRDGFEVGIACFELSEGEDPTRHTAVLVQLSRPHPDVRLEPGLLHRRPVAELTQPAGRRLAALPPRAELVEIQGRELYIRYHGWPEFIDLDVRVDAGIEVARALCPEDIGEPQGG